MAGQCAPRAKARGSSASQASPRTSLALCTSPLPCNLGCPNRIRKPKYPEPQLSSLMRHSRRGPTLRLLAAHIAIGSSMPKLQVPYLAPPAASTERGRTSTVAVEDERPVVARLVAASHTPRAVLVPHLTTRAPRRAHAPRRLSQGGVRCATRHVHRCLASPLAAFDSEVGSQPHP